MVRCMESTGMWSSLPHTCEECMYGATYRDGQVCLEIEHVSFDIAMVVAEAQRVMQFACSFFAKECATASPLRIARLYIVRHTYIHTYIHTYKGTHSLTDVP
jgi:hypothetical protein